MNCLSHKSVTHVAKGKICYMCGAQATTRDHVPPKSMFKHLRGIALPVFPACKACNEGFSQGDHVVAAIFGLTASKNQDVWENARQMVNGKRSSILRVPDSAGYLPGNAHLQALTKRAMHPVDIVSPAGIIIDKTGGFSDPELGTAAQNLAKRLLATYWLAKTNTLLKDNFTNFWYYHFQIKFGDNSALLPVVQTVIQAATDHREFENETSIFGYMQDGHIWIVFHYHGHVILATTMIPEIAKQKDNNANTN